VTAPTVIFQVTAIGTSPKALAATARSVLYWVRRTPKIPFRYLVWLIIEPEGYATDPELYETLRGEGVVLLVVPEEYRTKLGTTGKGRALHYGSEERIRRGLSDPLVWVYHQDEETCVGQDTLEGISEFVARGDRLVGTGVILYPLDWVGSPSHVQELTRSFDDFRVLDSMTSERNPTSGFHGSHFLARADVEDAIGWDARGYVPGEDLLFEIRVRKEFGSVFGLLKGFAYEKGAFSMRDQLRQRRRWVHGVLFALRPSVDVPARRRAALAYSALSWFSALPSVAVLVASAVFHYGPLLIGTGVFTGFIWTTMVLAYLEGFRLHRRYVDRRRSWPRLVAHGVLGALVDVVAPWYALGTRPSYGDFIPKDRPTTNRHASPTVPTARG
jgi:egghead protein (zeste-white 4 protein)